MLARVLAVVVCLYVCLSVTRRYCVKTLNVESRKQRHVIAQRLQQSLAGDAPFPLNFALKVTHPLSNTTNSTNILT